MSKQVQSDALPEDAIASRLEHPISYRNVGQTQIDNELEPLRTRDDFQTLVKEIEDKIANPAK